MKKITFKIYGNKKSVIISKDFMTILIGAALILLSAVLLGLLEFLKAGCDLSAISEPSFWTSYIVKLVILYFGLAGIYIIKRTINMQSPKIVIPREVLKENKRIITSNYKTSDFEFWLKNVYNYNKKVEEYREYLTAQFKLYGAQEPKTSCKNYDKKLKRYNECVATRLEIENQLKLCDKHLEIIDLYRKHKKDEAKALYETIKDNDGFRFFKNKVKVVHYEKLFNVETNGGGQEEDISYNEMKSILRKVMPSIFLGAVMLAFMTSLVLERNDVSLINLIYIGINLLTFIWYLYTGNKLANHIVFSVIQQADNNRLKICSQYVVDCKANGDEWVSKFGGESDVIDQLQKENENNDGK